MYITNTIIDISEELDDYVYDNEDADFKMIEISKLINTFNKYIDESNDENNHKIVKSLIEKLNDYNIIIHNLRGVHKKYWDYTRKEIIKIQEGEGEFIQNKILLSINDVVNSLSDMKIKNMINDDIIDYDSDTYAEPKEVEPEEVQPEEVKPTRKRASRVSKMINRPLREKKPNPKYSGGYSKKLRKSKGNYSLKNKK